jgi:hypothetical protein
MQAEGTIINVNIDGSGDYLSIQLGITEATDGDTVLVYPGEYFENVDFMGKTIVLGSLYLLTSEREYIGSTIINGNQENSCVRVSSGEEVGTKLCGFTLINGSGYIGDNFASPCGGGVIVFESALIIDNCIIEENTAVNGGGILICSNRNVYLKGCTIRNNQSSWFGGGLSIHNMNSEITFDEEDRCNIYNNYSGMGNDICSRYIGGTVTVFVDTLTCNDYWGYNVVQWWYGEPNIIHEGFELDMQHSWIDQIDYDLYVAPWGNDNNSGLSHDEPLQRISWALQKIASNVDNPHTIYLSDGVYSHSGTGELFPLQMKGWVTLSGESSETTILDGDQATNIIFNYYLNGDIRLDNLRIMNAASLGGSECDGSVVRVSWNFDSEIFLNNIVFENNQPTNQLIQFETESNIYMNNITAINNGEDSKSVILLSSCNDDEPLQIVMNNILLRDNNCCQFMLNGNYNVPSLYFNNLLISDNNLEYTGTEIYNYSSFWITFWQNTYLTNCTIANNDNQIPSPSGVIQIADGANLEITNSIIYDNNTDYLVLDYNFSNTELNIYNSLFDFNESDFKSPGLTSVYYNPDTIFSGDPLFTYQEDRPQSLLLGSPCIDGGTMELPEGIELPDTDVYGNQRIYGNGIDIGAIEWQGTPVNYDDLVQKPMEIMVYPNPLISSQLRDGQAKILWLGESESEDMEFEIFNLKGQRIRELKIDNVKLKINTAYWDLKDNSGSQVSSGVYFIRMKAGGEYKAQRKVVVCN